jgi:hypothetical protein
MKEIKLVFEEDLQPGTLVSVARCFLFKDDKFGIVLDVKRTGSGEPGHRTLQYLVLSANQEPLWTPWGYIDYYYE